MPYQHTAMNNETIPSILVDADVLRTIAISRLPKGFLGIDIKNNLAKVIQRKDRPPVFMKLGKVLKADNFTDKEIRDSSASLKSLSMLETSAVKFARTEEEIIDVYERGPHSCMRGKDCVQVYASPDLAVAYLEINGDIKSRTVVCVNEDIGLHYVSIYGFGPPLKYLLTQLGYIAGDLEGCRLLKIEDRYSYVAPFLDGITGITIEDDYLYIDSSGDEDAASQDGTLRHETCECCGERINDDNSYYSEHLQETQCESCFDTVHVRINDEYYHTEDEDVIQLDNGEWCMRDDTEYVDSRDAYYHRDDVVYNNHNEEYYPREDLNL